MKKLCRSCGLPDTASPQGQIVSRLTSQAGDPSPIPSEACVSVVSELPLRNALPHLHHALHLLRVPQPMFRAIVLILVLLLPSCSFAFVEGPPQVRPGGEPPTPSTCTTEMTLPYIDIFGGLVSGLAGVALVFDERSDEYENIGILTMTLGLVLVTSGRSGHHRVTGCRDFLEALSIAESRSPLSPRAPAVFRHDQSCALPASPRRPCRRSHPTPPGPDAGPKVDDLSLGRNRICFESMTVRQ